mmetsp:Transcript_27008/g.61399  ORF Transcript_27008/g.61399 Transcript_27008/m.61399 type:complete len:344 (+) Transcript_27008:256-1287(+)
MDWTNNVTSCNALLSSFLARVAWVLSRLTEPLYSCSLAFKMLTRLLMRLMRCTAEKLSFALASAIMPRMPRRKTSSLTPSFSTSKTCQMSPMSLMLRLSASSRCLRYSLSRRAVLTSSLLSRPSWSLSMEWKTSPSCFSSASSFSLLSRASISSSPSLRFNALWMMTAVMRLEITKVMIMMFTSAKTKTVVVYGISGRTMEVQPSRVIIWNSVNMALKTSPKRSVTMPKIGVAVKTPVFIKMCKANTDRLYRLTQTMRNVWKTVDRLPVKLRKSLKGIRIRAVDLNIVTILTSRAVRITCAARKKGWPLKTPRGIRIHRGSTPVRSTIRRSSMFRKSKNQIQP